MVHIKPREPNPSGVMTMPPEPPELRMELQQQLDELKAANTGVALDCHLIVGDPAEDIVRLAAEKNCDLIVMGTHGRSGFSRLLMGSVAEMVSRTAPCAVMTLRAPGR